MIRRQFIKLATLTGATSLAAFRTFTAAEADAGKHATHASGARTVTWSVRGFTCVTCAVGLETMLRQQKGVVSAEASYPNANVTIQFHPDEVTETSLRAFISELGFTANDRKG